MMIDIATAVILLACVFSTVTGKAAARKRRRWPAWCVCGAVLGPFALLYVLLAPPLEPCPSCGRNIRVTPGRPCRHCAWTPPPAVKSADVASELKEAFGFRLGDTASRVEKSLTGADTPFEREGETRIRCARETFGHPADVTIELDEGRVRLIRVSYPADPNYKIYYGLKAAFVSKYGKPNYDTSDGEHTDNWTAKKLFVSLRTTPRAAPSTTVIYQKLDKKSGKRV